MSTEELIEHALRLIGSAARDIACAAKRVESAGAPAPDFTTVADAAARIGVGEKALRGAVNRGEVPVYDLGTRAGGRRRVRLDEVREWALGTRIDPKANARETGDRVARGLARGRAMR